MKKPAIALVVLGAVCALLFYVNTDPGLIISSLAGRGDLKGRELVYRINLFGIIPVAEAVFTQEFPGSYQGQGAYRLGASARPIPLFAGVFKGSASLESYVNALHRDPVVFRQTMIIPGKDTVTKEVWYDQTDLVMTIGEVKRQILAHTQDPLSAIAHIRRMDFEKRKAFEMNINTNQKNYVLSAQASTGEVSAAKQKYRTVALRSDIRRRDKNPYHKSNIDMVLVRDEGNLPVLIKVFASGMFIAVKLTEVR